MLEDRYNIATQHELQRIVNNIKQPHQIFLKSQIPATAIT